MFSKLQEIVLIAPVRFAELLLIALTFNTSIWLLSPYDVFANAHYWRFLSDVADEQVFGTWMLFGAILHLIGLLGRQDQPWRSTGAMFNGLNYLFISVAVALTPPWNPSVFYWPIVSVAFLLVYLRVSTGRYE